MPIVNKGIFTVNSIYERQVGNDWPSAQVTTTSDVIEVGSNLYYTDTRVQTFLDVSGYQTAANIISNVSVGIDLSSNTTTDLAEGDNLYYTNARVQSYLDGIGVAGIDLSGNTTTDLSEGDNLYYTNARVLAHLAESDVSVQDLTIAGNLFVQGDTTTLNTATLVVEDKNIVLANGAVNAAAADGAGITIDGASATILYASTGDKFEINKPLDVNGYSVLTTNSATTNLPEGTNLYYTNARVASHVATLGYISGIDLSSNTTTDLAEGDNLYYTNARVQSYLDEVGISGINLSSNTTTDLAEGDNLYYTNARVGSYVETLGYITGIDLSSNTTTDLAEGDNLYYTNARVASHVSTLGYATTSYVDSEVANLVASAPETLDTLNELAAALGDDENFASNVIALIGTKADIASLTTSNVTELTNLYYTNARVQSHLAGAGYQTAANILANVSLGTDLSSNTTTDLAEGDNLYYTNSRVQAYLDDNGITAGGGTDLSGNTTTDLAEGDNLYYTNSRVRSAFSEGAGSKLTISQSTGSISIQDVSADFNVLINGTAYSNVDSTMSNVLVFPENEDSSVRYILRSLHVTNISENDAHISGNIVFTGDISVPFASKMPIPYGTSLEMLLRPQAFTQLEQIQLQGFDQNESATADLISAVLTYETVYNKSGIGGTGNVVTLANTYVGILESTDSSSIIESIRLINLDSTTVKTRIAIADANDVILSHLSYNLSLPSKSSVEILQSPKRINSTEKILAYVGGTEDVSVIVSYRGAAATVTEIGTYSSSYSSGGNVSLEFNTTIENGTEVFYTIE